MSNTPTRPVSWTVLLLGGSPGIGKTLVAERVARHLGLPWGEADDFYRTLHDATSPGEQPALHCFDDDAVWDQEPAKLCDCLRSTAQVVSSSMESVVGHHISTASPIVLEGVWLLPALAAQSNYSGVPSGEQVRAVFVLELDEKATMKGVPSGGLFDRKGAARKRNRAQAGLLYSQWLAGEAARCGIPVLPVQPWTSLTDRILATLQ